MASALSNPSTFHGANSNPRHYSKAEWHAKKSDIKQLYIDSNQTLEQVVTKMSREHNFHATRRMYVTRLEAWGLAKNYTKTRVLKLLHKKRERGAVIKASKFGENGGGVDVEKIEKYLKRKNMCLETFWAEEEEHLMNTGDGAASHALDQEDIALTAQRLTGKCYEDNCPYRQSAQKFRLIDEFVDGPSHRGDSFGLHSYIAVDEKRPCTEMCFCRQHEVSTDFTFLVHKSSSAINVTFFSNALYSKLIELIDFKTLHTGVVHHQNSLSGLALLREYNKLKAYLDTLNSGLPNSTTHSLFSELRLLVDGFLSDGEVFKSFGYENLYERGFLDFKLWKKFQQSKLQRDISSLSDGFFAVDDLEDELIPPTELDIPDLDPVDDNADFNLAGRGLYIPLVDLPYHREGEMPGVMEQIKKPQASPANSQQDATWSPEVESIAQQPDNSVISGPGPLQKESTSIDKDLCDAAETGSLEQAQSLLDRGADLNPKYHPPLLKAAYHGHLDVVKLLLDRGASASFCRLSHALVKAASGGHPQVAHLLLDWGAEISPLRGNKIPLIEAIKAGQVPMVALLLDRGANPETLGRWKDGWISPMALAVKKRDVKISQLLLDRGADLFSKYFSFKNTLLEAAKEANLALVQVLLDCGSQRVDIHTFDSWVAELVQESRLHDNYLQNVLENILVLSAANGKRRIMDRLLHFGVNIDALTQFGTPLSSSARAGQESIVRRLLRKGANIQDAAIFLRANCGSQTTVARLFEIEVEVRTMDTASGAGLSSQKAQNFRCLRGKFIAQYFLMLQKAKISNTGFRKLSQEFGSYRELWSAGIKTLRTLCHGHTSITFGNTMAFLCLAKAIAETLETINSFDLNKQFHDDLYRWMPLFEWEDRRSYREAISSMWSIDLWRWPPTYIGRSKGVISDFLIEISQLASILIGEVNEPLGLHDLNNTGLESSQYQWQLRNNNSPPSTASANSVPILHPTRDPPGPPPEIIHPRPPDSSVRSTTTTLGEEVMADVSTVVKPMVMLLMAGAIFAIVIMFLQWLRNVCTISTSNRKVFNEVSTLQERYWILERYMGLNEYKNWIPEHPIGPGKEVAPFDDFFDSALYYGNAFS